MHNLIRMKNANILCPEVIMLKKHVLVMKFIGKEGKPAPSLKDANLNEEEVKQCYQEVVQVILTF
jgi:RIO kinase 3 (yeast)